MTEKLPEGLREDLFYTSGQLAELLRISPRSFETWRYKRTGPKFIAVSNRCVRYRGSAVLEWLATFESAPQTGAAEA